jgi:hypothetical protein
MYKTFTKKKITLNKLDSIEKEKAYDLFEQLLEQKQEKKLQDSNRVYGKVKLLESLNIEGC